MLRVAPVGTDVLVDSTTAVSCHNAEHGKCSALNPILLESSLLCLVGVYRYTAWWKRQLGSSVAYPELVSRGVSERRKCRPKCLVRVGTSNGVTGPLIKKIMAVGGGVSGQPEKNPGYATGVVLTYSSVKHSFK